MITPAYSPTATERVLPKLALDFTTAALDSRVTVTRALNTATRINSSGLIETVNADLPRFDYTFGVGGACKGLLIEEARTNKLTYSNTFTNGAWTKQAGVNLSVSPVASPDGTFNATRVEWTAASGGTGIFQTGIAITGAANSKAIWVRANSAGTIIITDPVTGFGTGYTLVTLSTTWTRVYLQNTAGQQPANGGLWVQKTVSSPNEIDIYNGQLEIGAFPTSDIVSVTTSATRNADVVEMSGTNFSSWFNATEGTFVANAETYYPQGFGNRVFWCRNTATATYNDAIYMDTRRSQSRWQAGVRANGADQFVQDLLTAASPSTAALAYKASSFAAAINGGSAISSSSGTVPTVNAMRIGSHTDGTFLNGYMRKLMFYPQRLINAEVTAFSK